MAGVFCSCSSSYHARKALKKNPQAFKADTVVVIDTVITQVPKIDTAFVYTYDTVEYIQEDVVVRFHFDTLTQKVFIEADCPDDTTLTETKTITETLIVKEPCEKGWFSWLPFKAKIYVIGSILIVGGIAFFILKLFK